jgi:hypothetical protein
MKDLIDCIIDQYYILSHDEMYLHMCIDYYFDRVFESHGIFNGCEELSNYITKRIVNQLNKNKMTELVIKNSEVDLEVKFFDELIINYKIGNIKTTEGEISDSNEINLIIPDNYKFLDIKRCLMHELTHKYTNYWMSKHGKSLFDALKMKDICLIQIFTTYLLMKMKLSKFSIC